MIGYDGDGAVGEAVDGEVEEGVHRREDRRHPGRWGAVDPEAGAEPPPGPDTGDSAAAADGIDVGLDALVGPTEPPARLHGDLWAGNLFASPFYIFLLRQFFLGLPRELFEAARVDGASYLQLFRKIALPLTKPALIVTFVFEFRASWTDLMRPLIYLRDGQLFTLPRGLKVILDQFGQGGEGQWEVVLAASVIATVPMLIIFFLGQRYFVEGIATTGRKG